MRRLFCAIGVASLVASAIVSAQQPEKERSPVQQYRGKTEAGLLICKLHLQLEQAIEANPRGARSVEVKPDAIGCRKELAGETRNLLDSALETLDSEAAKSALKTYHVAFATALKGIEPGMGEHAINYDARQQRLQEKMTEAWVAFELGQ